MVGGGGGTPEPGSHDARKRKISRRLGIRIDMTPLVDVAFLLLTFFMLTTSMVQPQAMEINVPPDRSRIEVPEKNLLTLRADENGSLYVTMRNPDIETAQRKTVADLRSYLREKSSNPQLVVIVKVDRKCKYSTIVDIMDELSLANISRFCLVPMTDKDKAAIARAQA